MEQGTPTVVRRPFEEVLADAVANKRQAGTETMEAKADAAPDIIVERNKTHGDFSDNARVSQALKRAFRTELGWDLLTDTERECMDMIALKFSRILSGKPLELQHWEDVVGYARLAEKLCK